MNTYENIGLGIPSILVPKKDIDMKKWAVVACDQYTSQPEYWEDVGKLVGDAPSTSKIIYPEAFLEEPQDKKKARIQDIQSNMKKYLDDGIFDAHDGFIYVERSVGGKTRKGLMVALDLEKYDYAASSQTLIRATEGTIVERLPPRIKIREDAQLELPHIMVLIDDAEATVIEPLEKDKSGLAKLYDFDLMMAGGHIEGYLVNDGRKISRILSALEKLADRKSFEAKYNLRRKNDSEKGILLFAVGDGNHSLATAKAIWEHKKANCENAQKIMDDPARFALVEIVNVHDPGLHFEPIHRVLFSTKEDIVERLNLFYGNDFYIAETESEKEMVDHISHQFGTQKVGMISGGRFYVLEFIKPGSNLAVGTLQPFLDMLIKDKSAEKIDYVHGAETVVKLACGKDNVGFYLPAMSKSDLFKTVILDGVLPRKTFSMGEAFEKRFYLEARKII